MKSFTIWLHTHPAKACGFSCWFTFAATTVAYDQVALWVGSCLFLGGVFWWILTYLQDTQNDWKKE